jgi:hypothetical protein
VGNLIIMQTTSETYVKVRAFAGHAHHLLGVVRLSDTFVDERSDFVHLGQRGLEVAVIDVRLVRVLHKVFEQQFVPRNSLHGHNNQIFECQLTARGFTTNLAQLLGPCILY